MLVHSYLYYSLDTSIVSDGQWQAWADELATIEPYAIGWYDNTFADWDGATGCHLPGDAWVQGEAARLLRYHEQLQDVNDLI